ncbi:MAG: HupE/UreJ family protein [Maricaulaceae bacterium]|jgi:hypothetical protein
MTSSRGLVAPTLSGALLGSLVAALFVGLTLAGAAWGHDISASNARFVEGIEGPAIGPFLYLGAKHMVTGLDHVFFLIGVVFYLFRLRDVVTYVSLFTLGHSLTLIGGVLAGGGANAYIVDAIIGFSVVYKAFENMGGFKSVLKLSFDPRIAVFAFGLAHGLGLATKLTNLTVSEDGLLVNLLSFNVGVELGQVLVLAVVVTFLNVWRSHRSFERHAFLANALLMTGGFILAIQQIVGYVTS